MRGRNDDPDLWGELYDRFRGPGDPGRRPRGLRGLPPESSGRLIDAALGVLGSVRTLVEVAEDLLEERRASHGGAAPAADPWVRPAGEAPRVVPADEEGGIVRDIPLTGA